METESEVWKPAADFEGYYEVSTVGRVRSTSREVRAYANDHSTRVCEGRVLKPTWKNRGYVVCLSVNGLQYQRAVHVLVARTFLAPPEWEGKLGVGHRDGNRRNNRVDNLIWMTQLKGKRHQRRAVEPPVYSVTASSASC